MKLILLIASLVLGSAFATSAQTPVDLVAVPDINGRATLLVQPELPADAMLKADSRTLVVKIAVDANGDVVSAQCSKDCPKAAAAAAEKAASASKFRPLIVDGRAVGYGGYLIYTIAVAKIDWFRFSSALYSVYLFDNLSLGPVANMLTSDYSNEKLALQDLDANPGLERRWATIERVSDTIQAKLTGADRWWFDLGYAMREITAPFQSDRRLDLKEVQASILKLSTLVETAPADIPPATVEKLRTLYEFKIEAAATPDQVRLRIQELARGIRP